MDFPTTAPRRRRSRWARRDQVILLQVVVVILVVLAIGGGVEFSIIEARLEALEAMEENMPPLHQPREDSVVQTSEAEELLARQTTASIINREVPWIEGFMAEAQLDEDTADLLRGILVSHILEHQKITGRMSSGRVGLEEATRLKTAESERVQKVLERVLDPELSTRLQSLLASNGF